MNFIVDLSIYPYDIMFSIGQTDKEFKKSVRAVMKKKYYRDLVDDEICVMGSCTVARTFHHNIGGQTIVRLRKIPADAAEYGVLAHEIFHAVELVFRRVGMKLDEGSDEAYAYAIQYVTEKFWERISG